MELLRVIREESGVSARFESALAKAAKEDLLSPVSNGRNILHFICSLGYTKYASLVLNEAAKR